MQCSSNVSQIVPSAAWVIEKAHNLQVFFCSICHHGSLKQSLFLTISQEEHRIIARRAAIRTSRRVPPENGDFDCSCPDGVKEQYESTQRLLTTMVPLLLPIQIFDSRSSWAIFPHGLYYMPRAAPSKQGDTHEQIKGQIPSALAVVQGTWEWRPGGGGNV